MVDIPKDVSLKTTAFHYPESVEMRSYNPVRKGHGGQIRKALQLLLNAKRPYIYTGGGVLLSEASAELRTLVDMLGYPVTNTLMGLGAYPATDRKFLGMLGMHGTIEANNTMQNCDVLLAVGTASLWRARTMPDTSVAAMTLIPAVLIAGGLMRVAWRARVAKRRIV